MQLNALAASAAVAICLANGAQADLKADLVIEGRAAQALHCSAMLVMVSAVLADAGMITAREADRAFLGAAVMLDHVPGRDAQKKQAMRQRFSRIADSRSLPDLLREYTSTAKWCNAHFLPK